MLQVKKYKKGMLALELRTDENNGEHWFYTYTYLILF
jgi:hypothetical protein